MKKDKKILVIKKYKKSKTATLLLSVGLGLFLICYIIILILIQFGSVSDSLFSSELIVVLNVAKDFLLVVISIIGTTLLTALLIEINQKNATYTELIANDIFASPEFYSNLTDENKRKIIENLEEEYYGRFPIMQELYGLFREKLNSFSHNYYYEECNYNVSYYSIGSSLEKTIVRTMKIRSYTETVKIKNFYVCRYSLSPNENIHGTPKSQIPFQIVSISINGIVQPMDNIVVEEQITSNQLLDKCGYSSTCIVKLKNDIILTSDNDTIIRIKYKSIVTKMDDPMSFRVPVPCIKYILNCTAPSEYKVVAHAFGFFDSASNSSNSIYDNTISVTFDNWLMPDNGVAICCIDKTPTKKTKKSIHA